MKKGLFFIAVGLLVIGYLNSSREPVATNNRKVKKISEIEPVSQELQRLRDAYTSTWKGHAMAESDRKNLQSPGQIVPTKPAVTAAKKKEDLKKKKKKIARKLKRKGFDVQIVNNNGRPHSANTNGTRIAEATYPVPYVASTESQNETPTDVEGWMKRLTNPVNKEALDNLILSFQSGLITGELFYAVVDELIKSDEMKVQELGLIALNATPSPQSFDRTVKFIERESSNNTNADNARDVIMSYKKIELVHVLNNQIYSIDAGIQFQAVKLIRESALDMLKLKPQQDPNAPQPSPGPSQTPIRAISSRNLRVYEQSFTAIQSILASGRTSNQAIFQETIQILEQLLKS